MRLIDADALTQSWDVLSDGKAFDFYDIDEIDNALIVDAVPVVRCKECKCWNLEHISCEGYARCLTGESGVRYRKENDFCSYGERRGE